MHRRHALLSLASAIGLSGCIGQSGSNLVIRNNHNTTHAVAVTFYMGSGYNQKTESVTLEPDTERVFSGFIPSSDWDYRFVLIVWVDGEHAITTQHKWDPHPYTVTIRHDGRAITDYQLFGETPSRPLREWRENNSSTPSASPSASEVPRVE